jgi:hypothetical protein
MKGNIGDQTAGSSTASGVGIAGVGTSEEGDALAVRATLVNIAELSLIDAVDASEDDVSVVVSKAEHLGVSASMNRNSGDA